LQKLCVKHAVLIGGQQKQTWRSHSEVVWLKLHLSVVADISSTVYEDATWFFFSPFFSQTALKLFGWKLEGRKCNGERVWARSSICSRLANLHVIRPFFFSN